MIFKMPFDLDMDYVTTFLATEDPTSLLAMWNEMFLSPKVAYGVLQNVVLVAPLVTKAFSFDSGLDDYMVCCDNGETHRGGHGVRHLC